MPRIGIISDGYDYALSQKLRELLIGEVEFLPDVRLECISESAASQECDLTLVLIADEAFKRLDKIHELDDDNDKIKYIESLALDIVSQLESCEDNARAKGGEVLFAFIPTLYTRKEREAWYATSKSSHKFAIRLLNSEIAKRIDQSRRITVLDGVSEIDSRCSKIWFRISSYWDALNSEILAKQLMEHLALRTREKKMIILDLDNTLWGGILSEDTKDGIQLGQDSAKGKIYQEVHRFICRLRRNGYLISICSKNDTEPAKDCLFTHYGSLLKEEDIVADRINWTSKADNVRSIAEEIGIGLDTCVFIDDNYIECNEVESRCPGIESIIVPRNIYDYPIVLLSSDLLIKERPSQEDRERTNAYRSNRMRIASAKSLGDGVLSRSQWLSSLGMRLDVKKLNSGDRAIDRIVQLFSRTNQFNLYYSKYSHSTLVHMASDPDTQIYYAALSDKYGSDGIVACIITKTNPAMQCISVIDFVMSCRVFGRGVESAFLKSVLRRQYTPHHVEFRVRNIGKNAASARFIDSFPCICDPSSLVDTSVLLDQIDEDHLNCQWI
jgi:FkbH-like protein